MPLKAPPMYLDYTQDVCKLVFDTTTSIEVHRGLYEVPFREHAFLVSTCSAVNPYALLQSFLDEADLRHNWWQIQPGDVVIDVGAGYGSYTLSALAAGASKVCSIEPSRSEYFELSTNLLLNSFQNRSLHLNCLAGDTHGLAARFFPENHSCCFNPVTPGEWRLSVPLDSLCSQAPKVDWLKVDVEGAEGRVLRGALNLIQTYHPKILVENHLAYFPEARQEITAILEPLGYQEENCFQGEASNNNWSLWTYG